MKVVDDFEEYQILDMASGMKVENWQGIILERPDPQIIWDVKTNESVWTKIDAKYERSSSGGGKWNTYKKIPDLFYVNYHDLKFCLKLMSFKHTGLFPEQAYNWNLIEKKISGNKNIKVLNLFAYTGAASVVALKAGAIVTHVDSSKGMTDWAKENVKTNHLDDKPIRFLVDDVFKFVKREINRGSKYDIIIMDPPSFGRGAKSEVWSIENDLFELVSLCSQILSDKPILFLINSYTTGLSMTVLENILELTVNKKYHGYISSDELGLPMKNSNLVLPCGIYARWESTKADLFDENK